MRPIERKIYNKITKDGISFDEIWEIVDRTSTQELKKSYPDDCHFHNDKYFAKQIADTLQRRKLVRKEGNKFYRIDFDKKEEKK